MQQPMRIGVYERHMRKGIRDFLPATASKYDRALAVCADGILAEAQFDTLLGTSLDERYKTSHVLSALESVLYRVLKRRAHRTLEEATEAISTAQFILS